MTPIIITLTVIILSHPAALASGFAPGPAPAAQTQEASQPRLNRARLGTGSTENYEATGPADFLPPDTRQVVCVWGVDNIPAGGTTIGARWVAEDTRGAAPPDYLIAEASKDLPGPQPMAGNFSLSRPNNGWPAGRYRVELYLGGRLAGSLPFRFITAAEAQAYDAIEPLLKQAGEFEAKGDYGRAISLTQQALSFAEEGLGPEHRDTAAVLNNLALLYKEAGAYDRSEELHRRALATAEKLGGHDYVVPALSNLALLYVQTGDFLQAEQLLARALSVAEKGRGPESELYAGVLNNQALNAYSKGDYKQALRLYERALSVYSKTSGEETPSVITLLNNVAEAYRQQGDIAGAEPLLRRALAGAEKAYSQDSPDLAVPLNNLALVLTEKGDYVQADALFRRVLSIYEKALGPEHASTGAALLNMALLRQDQGDYDRAEALYGRALKVFERSLGASHPNVAEALKDLGMIAALKGSNGRATEFLTRSGEVRERNLSLLLTTGGEEQKQVFLDRLYGETLLTISFHLRNAPDEAGAARLALTTLLRRKGRALDVMSDQVAALRRRLGPGDGRLLDQLSAARAELAALTLGGRGAGAADAARRAAALEEEVRRLEAEVGARSAEYRTQSQPVTLERVQAATPQGAALVEYVRYHPFDFKAKRSRAFSRARYAAYVLRREGAPAWAELGDADAIDAQVGRLRSALADPSDKGYAAAARSLDASVAAPVRKLLGDAGHVFISPDGQLNLIPFGALVDEAGKYLLEGLTITYLTSGRDLLRTGQEAPEGRGALVVADPAFGTAGGPDTTPAHRGAQRRSSDLRNAVFSPLPGTEGEARALGEILEGAKVLTKGQATEAALKEVAAPRILHVATHGFFLPDQDAPPSAAPTSGRGLFVSASDKAPAAVVAGENPLLRSGLALSGANVLRSVGGEDGVLTAIEAAGLNLWGTRLVVLSACETGVGEVRNGAGVYGLRRALVLAGSQSQVMSLWQVDDAATRDLMVSYYKRLQAGEGRTEALRAAQLEMAAGGSGGGSRQTRALGAQATAARADRSHPFFWAAFIQSGDWRPLGGK